MKYNCIIVDDEQFAIDIIADHLRRFDDFQLEGMYTSPIDAFQRLESDDIDLVFSDIAMPKLSGLDLVRMYKGSARFIITTAYSEYALQSFDLDVVDYLLKPVSFPRFSKSLERFKNSISYKGSKRGSLFIKEGDDFVRLRVEDVIYIEGMGDYAKIYTDEGYHLVLKTLKSLESFFSDEGFMRVHKSFIVSLSKIKRYRNSCLVLGRVEISVGPAYRDRLKKFLTNNQL